MKSSGRVSGLLLGAALLAAPAAAWASSLTVPDEVPTIQSAIDAAPETIFVRPGAYAESPILHYSVVVMPTLDATTMPVLDGLGLGQLELTMSIQRLDVLAPVVLGPGSPPLNPAAARPARLSTSASQQNDCIDFLGCRLRGGMIDSTNYVDLQCMTFHRCTIEGDVGAPPRYGGLGLRSYCLIESCTVTGTIDTEVQSPIVEVRGCAFTGAGVGMALGVGGGGTTLIEGNTIRGYETGIGAGPENGTVIQDNLVEDCSYRGIGIGVHGGHVLRNTVRRCGEGMDIPGEFGTEVMDNVVDRCQQTGIVVFGDAAHVSGNIIHDGAQDGLAVYGDGEFVIERNTLVRNAGSGLLWRVAALQGTPVVRQNIGYANGVNGVQWSTSNVTTVACNDWFGNQGGDVAGMPPSPADLSVNPIFCDELHDNFYLLATSSLANQPSCGQIGALGVGCAATATLVTGFTAEREPEGIRILWSVGAGAVVSEVWIERSESGPDGPWSKPKTESSHLGDVQVEVDHGARSDQDYWYRLMATVAGATTQLGAVHVPAASLIFALGRVGPSPSSGPVTIAFSLAHPARVQLEIFDLLGRRVTSLAHGEWQAGEHRIEWSAREAQAGVYLVRYRFPGGEAKRRLIRLP